MKKLFTVLLLLLAMQFAQAQATPITDTGALRTRINADIKANGTSAITGSNLNRILNGQLNVTQNVIASKVDSAALADSLQAFVRLQTQSPTATLNSDTTYELHSVGTFSSILSWSAGRLAANTTQNATNPLASIVVNGISQTFNQPNVGSSVSGTQSVTVTYNTDVSYTNLVTTTDNKTAIVTRTYKASPKYYIGYSTTSSPSDADLIAGINTIFPTTTRVTSGTLVNPTSSSYIFFAVPVSFGTPIININAAGVTYNNTTRSVTNASGYSQSYIISVSPFPTAAGVIYSVN